MKVPSYKGPIITTAIGVVITIGLLFGFLFVVVNCDPTSYQIDNLNNTIMLTEETNTRVYFYADYPYETSTELSGNVATVEIMSNSDVLTTYEITFENPTENEYTIELKEAYQDFLVFDSEEEVVLYATVEYISGIETNTLDISVEENPSFDSSILLFFLFLASGAVTLLGGGLYFIIVGVKRSSLKPKQPVYTRTTLYNKTPLEQLMETDQAFSDESQITKQEAWIKYTFPHVKMGTRSDLPFIKGHDEVRENITKLYQLESLEFKWKPQYGFVSNDATLGVTVGLYKREYILDGKQIEEKGKYISVWRNINGLWKIIYDMGN